MKKFKIKITRYAVQENDNGKIKKVVDGVSIKEKYFKNKTQARKELSYLNRSSANMQGTIKHYELTR